MAMLINRKWASGIKDGKPVYAPAAALTVGGRLIIAPKDVHYRMAGYLPVVDEAPTNPAPDGYHWAAKEWRKEAAQIVRVYEAVENPPAPARKFSKLRLYAALVDAGLWDAFETWLKGQTIEGVNGYTAFSLAQELSDDHPLFRPLYTAVKSALSLTDEAADRILELAQEG